MIYSNACTTAFIVWRTAFSINTPKETQLVRSIWHTRLVRKQHCIILCQSCDSCPVRCLNICWSTIQRGRWMVQGYQLYSIFQKNGSPKNAFCDICTNSHQCLHRPLPHQTSSISAFWDDYWESKLIWLSYLFSSWCTLPAVCVSWK